MARKDQQLAQAPPRAGQAAIELAVFGAILIFLFGTIIRTAVGNGLTQDENLRAMRMAMLASSQGSQPLFGNTAGIPTSMSRNNASVLIVEDRLSPDFIKYGSLDRSAYVASGSGTFSFMLLYPMGATEVPINLPIMDVYIDGQHFPFTTAGYNPLKQLVPTTCPSGGPYDNVPLTQSQCLQNQCLRNQREWVGGIVKASQFEAIIPLGEGDGTPSANAIAIFNELVSLGVVTAVTNPDTIDASGHISSTFSAANFTGFTSWFTPPVASYTTQQEWNCPSGTYYRDTNCGYTTEIIPVYTTNPHFAGDITDIGGQLNAIETILNNDSFQYKLFYTLVPNGGPTGTTGFTLWAPTVAGHPTKGNNELSTDLVLPQGCTSGSAGCTSNENGDLMYDLQRTNVQSEIESELPVCSSLSSCSDANANQCMRCNIAWQWRAAAGVPGSQYNNWVGVATDPNNNSYPSYDINGTLKEVTIYYIGLDLTNPKIVDVAYLDPSAGDVDTTWDSNTCGPKPGLQGQSQMYTFTEDGTYLQVKEGKLYNPETGQVVRSINKKNNVDLIQRQFQLSNNTGRFCNGNTPQPCVASCLLGSCSPSQMTCPIGSLPNPVEACVDGVSNNCFTSTTIKQTCFDSSDNMLFIRSRLQDLRGRYWITNASGQLGINK